MKNLTLLLSITLLAATNLFAQKRTIEVDRISSLSLGIPATVNLMQGNSETVEIECDDDIFEEIKFDQKGDRLTIRRDGSWNWGSSWRKSAVTINITMKRVEDIGVSGSGEIIGSGLIKSDKLQLSISGSGEIELEVEATDLDFRISGSGTIKMEGKANNAEAKISGSGKVRAEDLTVETFKASISGSGDCYITATEEVNARISGSGSVYYDGNPKRVISNASGSGKAKKM